MIAALYVLEDGPYAHLDGVDAWGESRDARRYRGPHPVVAHPPCKRWGRYWPGGPSVRERKLLGDDDGCFAAALWSVRTFGGVLEHPEASHAWRWHGIRKPPKPGGWVKADEWGWTCCVEQGNYGHAARKATWLYYVGKRTPRELTWGPAEGRRLDEGFHTPEERRAAREAGREPVKRLSSRENLETPTAFRDVLLELARGAR